MIDANKIATASRSADEQAKQGGIPGWAKRRDIEEEGLLYVAHQRGLRAALLLDGKEEVAERAMGPMKVSLSDKAQGLMPLFTANWLDGYAAGIETMVAAQQDSSSAVSTAATRRAKNW